ncbi:hypothetical protein [Novosphingobium sp. AP12]|uniref:hypothetical protein n=1 Tax=Novosphingobium sp. AP12 TaxID=1144305 RepID=UPI00027205E1|nr:hypothetical protein [Novosphingobium sp. AP12]EJL23965.1 hypothetical protein PMI02_03885 [Novosphingobium sp. AP12]
MDREETEAPTYLTHPELSISIHGIDDPEKAKEFGHTLLAHIFILSQSMDLQRVERLVVTDNYADGLASVDRGFAATAPVEHSQNENIQGVAMNVRTLRDGVPMVQIVSDIEVLLPLWVHSAGSPEHSQALMILAHEGAHAEDLKFRDEDCPGVLLQTQITEWVDNHLGPQAYLMWEEYYACRRTSGIFPEATKDFLASLLSSLETTPVTVDAAIDRFYDHQDVNLLAGETLEPAGRPLRLAAYLLGHLDGLDQDWTDQDELVEKIAGTPAYGLIGRMHAELRRLWDREEGWSGLDDFATLTEIASDNYENAGITVIPGEDGGAYISV